MGGGTWETVSVLDEYCVGSPRRCLSWSRRAGNSSVVAEGRWWDRREGGDGFGRGRDAPRVLRGLFYCPSARPKAETERFNGTQAWKWSMHWPSKASISASKRLSTCVAARQRGEWLSEEMRM